MKIDLELDNGLMRMKLYKDDETTVSLSGEPGEFRKMAAAILQTLAGVNLRGEES